jgi:HEAT repeat protein
MTVRFASLPSPLLAAGLLVGVAAAPLAAQSAAPPAAPPAARPQAPAAAPPAPAANGDEELKLYALDSLLRSDPDKAVPVLDSLLAGDSSLRVKRRALFVLAQSDAPAARQILVRVAREGQPIELRAEAVRTLGIAGDDTDLAVIAGDPKAPKEIREAVIQAYLISGHDQALVALAQKDPDPEVRAKAIQALGAMGSRTGLRGLLGSESDPGLRARLLESLGIAGDVETLEREAREESSPELRRRAIEGLGIAGTPEASAALRRLYTTLTDPADRRRVLDGFLIQGDSKTLIDLFHAEKDPAMKQSIVQKLSMLDDPEATKLMLEILGQKP